MNQKTQNYIGARDKIDMDLRANVASMLAGNQHAAAQVDDAIAKAAEAKEALLVPEDEPVAEIPPSAFVRADE